MANALSEQAIAGYRRDGFCFPVPALSAAEADGYLRGLEAFEARYGVQAGRVIRNKGHLKHLAFHELTRHPAILDAVEGVLGPNILCWGSSLFVKEAGDPGFVAWHQDSYYWGLEPDDVVSAWIALTPSRPENGVMRVVPGTHTAPAMPHVASPDGSPNMLFTHEEIGVDVDEDRAVALTLEQGEMSLHHVKIVHGSQPNRTDARRVGYAIRYVSPAVRQRGDYASATLVRGVDDYGHFAPDPVPTRDMDPEIVAFVDSRLGAAPGGATAGAAARTAGRQINRGA